MYSVWLHIEQVSRLVSFVKSWGELASAAARSEAEPAAADQAIQESGQEGRSILVERGAEVQEGDRVILDALRNRDPGLLEKVRTLRGQ